MSDSTRAPDTSAGIVAAENDAGNSARLDRSLAGGVAWTAGVKWLSQLLTWPATLVVVRLLSPDDYGLVAMGSVYVGLVNLVNEFGLGSAIIKHRELTRPQIAQLSGLCVLFGLGGFVLSAAAAYPLALFYHTPAVTLVVIALSVNFLLTSFKTVPLSLMQRDFQFKESALNEAVGAVVQSTTLVAFAYFGLRYWSLVLAFLLSSLATTILSYLQRPHALAWPVPSEIREPMRFGSHLVGSRIGWYLYNNADFFVVGRVLGQTALGAYSFGWSFATLPVEKVTTLIGRVAPPIFSAVQDDHKALRRYLTRLTGGIALLTLPAGVGLALVAPEFVSVALGDKWLAAIAPLRMLALFAAIRSIMPIVSQAGTAIGLAPYVMRNAIISAVVMPVAFLIGSHWGTSGVASAWLIAYPFVIAPLCVTVFRRIGLTAGEYARALWPALSSTALMAPAVFLAQRSVNSAWPTGVRLLVEVSVGALAYGAALWILHRGDVRATATLIKSIRQG